MPFRILFAAPLLLLLLSTDARAARLDPSTRSDLAVALHVPIKAKDLSVGRLGSLQTAAGPVFVRHRGGVLFLRDFATSGASSKPGRLQPILDGISRHGNAALLPPERKLLLPFQYHDYLRNMRLERRNLRRAPASSSVVVLPLPASGWLLGTAVLGCLLLGRRRRRTSRRQRQPLRYRTV